MKKFLTNRAHYLWNISLFSSLFILLAISYANAQTATLSAIIRPRFEVQDGYRFPPDTAATPQVLVSQRTRLNAGYTSEKVSAFISLQDARIWGDEVVASDVPSLGIHEAWAQYNFSHHVGLKVGRQELLYDNKRILTDGLWIQQGRAWDGATLKLASNNGWRVDAVGSFNQQVDNYYGNFYTLANPKSLDVLWVNKSKTDSIHNFTYSASAIMVADGYQSPDTTGMIFRYTYGLYATLNHHNWGGTLEIYGQSGKTRTINQAGNVVPLSFQKVSAYMFSVNPWFQVTRSFQVGAGIDYLSGSNALDTTNSYNPENPKTYPELDGTTHMFNPQYGAAHRFYGKMDMYFNLPAGTRNAGLVDIYVNLKYNYKGWDFSADYHHFSLQNNVEDVENPGKALSNALGSEIDLMAVKDLTKAVNLNTGFSLYFPTRSMEFVKTSSFSQQGSPSVTAAWFYVMLTFHPVFFSKDVSAK